MSKPSSRTKRFLLGCVATGIAVALALPAGSDEVAVVQMGDATGYRLLDLKWDNGPFPGSKVAVLAGDPSAGMHHSYLKLPDGCVIAPHWHSTDEYVTVVQGTVLVGSGEKYDEKAMRLFGPGGFVYFPAKSPHYARAKGQVVLSQTRGGATDTHWIDPETDPGKGKPAAADEGAKKK